MHMSGLFVAKRSKILSQIIFPLSWGEAMRLALFIEQGLAAVGEGVQCKRIR